MKVSKSFLLIITILGLCGNSVGQFLGDGPKQAVINSAHDLRNKFTGASQACDFCHAPNKYGTLMPEPSSSWNVKVNPGPYRIYGGSPTFAGSATIRDPSAAGSANAAAYMTMVCLSCHDGTVTEAVFYNRVDLGREGSFTAPNIGQSGGPGLSNDHPVDYVYSAALATADGGLKAPLEGAAIRVPSVGASALPLFKDQPNDASGRVECATCHNPHNNANGKFLRMANSGTALCLNCHGT
ncbi:MAG: cytochrome c3 family protein [Acidobacteria bacterium]|nr:cytochrome c3 family protein [Acidobacteriota bacterium]